MAPANTPGFFGKVMSYADFIARRIPPAFLQCWDEWLQAALQKARQQLGSEWLPTYLHSPIWRFALAAQACDAHAWAGIMMPSIDSVGRQFPLTIVVRLPQGVNIYECLRDGQDWYAQLESLALSSLSEKFILADFDLAVSAVPTDFATAVAGDPAGPACIRIAITGIAQLDSSLPSIATTLVRLSLHGHSLWWSDGSEKISPSLLLCKGLPAPASFAAMLDGRWQQAGWQSRPVN
jgi:type VI secretion system protein ImpM